MLAIIASRLPGPVEEPIDRDPGILTLAAVVFGAVRRGQAAAFRRRCDLAAATRDR